MLRYGSESNAAYESARLKMDGKSPTTVFRPNLAQRTSAGALEAMAAMSKALEAQLAKVSSGDTPAIVTDSKLGLHAPVAELLRIGCGGGALRPRSRRCRRGGVAAAIGRREKVHEAAHAPAGDAVGDDDADVRRRSARRLRGSLEPRRSAQHRRHVRRDAPETGMRTCTVASALVEPVVQAAASLSSK